MKHTKRVIAYLMAGLLSISVLAGCGQEKTAQEEPVQEEAVTEEAEAEE